MDKNIKKILAIISATTAIGVTPLSGLYSSKYTSAKAEIGNGIIDVIYNDSLANVNPANIDYTDVELVAEQNIEQESAEETTQEEIQEEVNNEPIVKYSLCIYNQNGFKSYMSYRCITNHSSNQYRLQEIAYTGDYGIRMIDGRYCIAVGTGTTANVGDYIDLVLNNGTVIPCVVGDIKDNQHTLQDNITTAANGCVSEFIIDNNSLASSIKRAGNVSKATESWDSPVSEFKLYNVNVLEVY